jgi:MGT family glycosyltransferase
MSKILVYTSPARGHLYPLVPTLEELRSRGHAVAVRTLSTEVERVRALGIEAAAIDAAIEGREIDDWRASAPPAALLAACRTFVERGRHEIADLRRAIDRERPDVLFTDVNSWGAAAAAEASGLPWAVFAPYFLPVRAPGVPPWGLGLAPMGGLLGRVRDAMLWPVLNGLYDRALFEMNQLRAMAGVAPFRHVSEFATHPPCVVSYTAEPFEYARAWPDNIRLVGPGIWEPDLDGPGVSPRDERPLVLVTCSTEFQNDGRLVEVALAALADEPVRIVATTASIDPAFFRAPPNARVERFLPHGPLLREAACVVCHGGMGITQKALAAGVPVCVVPFGRDQLEVARHVEQAGAGTRLVPRRLTPVRLRRAVREAMACTPGARRVAEGFRNAGGARAAAEAIEGLLAPGSTALAHDGQPAGG